MLKKIHKPPFRSDKAIEPNHQQFETIHGLFQKQVVESPNNIAISYKKISISYYKLNKLANQLAYYLQERYLVKCEDLIVLYLDRDEFMVIAMLAVLKAGGAYVPIDNTAPKDRINYILEDTRTKLVITNLRLASTLTNLIYMECCNILSIDDQLLQDYLAKYPITNLNINVTNLNLAYVIYTSGTTGNPKGVLQLHGNIVGLFKATNDLYKFRNNDVWTLFHSYVFDFSVWEIFGALFYGGKLVVVPSEVSKNVELFYKLCEKEKVTILNQTPNVFYQVIDIINKFTKLDSLRYVILGGDKLNFNQLEPWFKIYENTPTELINMYGITETTIHATYKIITKVDVGNKSNIGRFISSIKGYILDEELNPVSPGEVGELYLGGTGLARGYLNLPDLTSKCFIANPLQTKEEKTKNKNNRLYKTGDLVRYLDKDELEYIGRNDFQVKIRGFRIELGEIESTLMNYPGIKHAVVLVKEHTNTTERNEVMPKYLICYYVAETNLVKEKIINYLSKILPEYMVPNILVSLDNLPLTLNGKLDRVALLNYKIDRDSQYVPPNNELEIELCHIWSEILKIPVDAIGTKDDFFKLGGDSLLAVSLINRINSKYKCQIKIVDILIAKTMDKLIPLIKESNEFLLISNLNDTTDKLNLFMVHPAMAGSEVYIPLAQQLSSFYSCYGLDNYNLNNTDKIDNLSKLANLYLSAIDDIRQKTNQSKHPYLLLGWSFGGQVALEIASILEQRGFRNIWVASLDTVMVDESLIYFLNQAKEDLKRLYSYHITNGYLENYTEKLISNFECEQNLVYQKVSNPLHYSKIFLFKAAKYANEFIKNHDDINSHVAKLPFNNLDHFIKNREDIKVVQLENIIHDDVCEQTEFICQNLSAWYTKSY